MKRIMSPENRKYTANVIKINRSVSKQYNKPEAELHFLTANQLTQSGDLDALRASLHLNSAGYKAARRDKKKATVEDFCNFMENTSMNRINERHETNRFKHNKTSQGGYLLKHPLVRKSIHKGLEKADPPEDTFPTAKGQYKRVSSEKRAIVNRDKGPYQEKKAFQADVIADKYGYKNEALNEFCNFMENYLSEGNHPGFKAVQAKVAKKYGKEAAGRIVASAARNASKKAKAKNPRLKRVKG